MENVCSMTCTHFILNVQGYLLRFVPESVFDFFINKLCDKLRTLHLEKRELTRNNQL